MWGTNLSVPLAIVALVGRYPPNQLMARMPIPVRYLYPIPDARNPVHGALIRLSAGYSPDEGRLHTRYAPVRRSPAGIATPAAPRLAWTVTPQNIVYKCGWSPFENIHFSSKITHTFINGKLVYHNGQYAHTENTPAMALTFNR